MPSRGSTWLLQIWQGMFLHGYEVRATPAPLADLCSLLQQPEAYRPTLFLVV